MSKIETIKGWYVGEGLDEVSEEEAGKSGTDFEFVGSSERCEGRTVVVVCGVDVGRGLALCALAGAGGFVTVLIDEVSDMREHDGESRDWSDWEDSEVTGMKQRYKMSKIEKDIIDRSARIVMAESGFRDIEVADAQRRKSWQTCYGQAQRGIKRR